MVLRLGVLLQDYSQYSVQVTKLLCICWELSKLLVKTHFCRKLNKGPATFYTSVLLRCEIKALEPSSMFSRHNKHWNSILSRWSWDTWPVVQEELFVLKEWLLSRSNLCKLLFPKTTSPKMEPNIYTSTINSYYYILSLCFSHSFDTPQGAKGAECPARHMLTHVM